MEAYAADVADLSKSVDYWNAGWVGCHCIYRQMTNRKCLAIYLRRMAGKFSAKVSEGMLAAAQKYEDAYAAWLEWERHLGKDVRPDAWEVPENRLAGAAAVRTAIQHEKAAAEEIAKALAALELQKEREGTHNAQSS